MNKFVALALALLATPTLAQTPPRPDAPFAVGPNPILTFSTAIGSTFKGDLTTDADQFDSLTIRRVPGCTLVVLENTAEHVKLGCRKEIKP